MTRLLFLLTPGILVLLLPAVALAATAPTIADHTQLAMAMALLISEALALMPTRAKGIVHGALLVLRAIVENLN